MRILTQLWRLVRVAGVTFGAQSVAGIGSTSKAAVVAGVVAAVETTYRTVVPPRGQTWVATFVRNVALALREVSSATAIASKTSPGTVPVPKPATVSPPASLGLPPEIVSAPVVTPHVGP